MEGMLYSRRMDRILIFGGSGYIGTYLQQVYPKAHCPKGDIADPVFVAKTLDEIKPTVVINAAGKTGRPNVDWCEDHKEETVHANVIGPLVLLEECQKRGIYLVHIGSGCIYSGTSPKGGFTEEMTPNFSGSFYSLTKFTTDMLLQRFPVLNLRLRMPFDGTRNPRNLIVKLTKYAKVLDTKNSLTYIPDFLMALQKFVAMKKTGTFNVVNEGALSPFDIATRYKEIVDSSHAFERLALENLGTVVKADRSNCILSGEKLKQAGVTMRSSEEALTEALQAMNNAR